MRTILHVERRRAPRRSLALVPRDARRTRRPRRLGLHTRCAYLPAVSYR
jgi:hypothetical protein